MTNTAHRSDPSTPEFSPGPSRRPIRARGTAWAGFLATRLSQAGVSPNAISLASVAWAAAGAGLFVAIGWADLAPDAALYAGVIVCIAMRSLCNMLDGMVAVEGGRATASGAIYNEFPDRVSDALFLVGAGSAVAALPWGAQLGWLAALLAVATAYSRSLGAANGVGDDFGGPMAKPTRMAVLAIGCCVAAIETIFDRGPTAVYAALALICVGCVITIVLRLRRTLRSLERST